MCTGIMTRGTSLLHVEISFQISLVYLRGMRVNRLTGRTEDPTLLIRRSTPSVPMAMNIFNNGCMSCYNRHLYILDDLQLGCRKTPLHMVWSPVRDASVWRDDVTQVFDVTTAGAASFFLLVHAQKRVTASAACCVACVSLKRPFFRQLPFGRRPSRVGLISITDR